MTNDEPTVDHWRECADYLRRKWQISKKYPTFWLYFIFAVVIAGGCGIWVAVYQQLQSTDWKWDSVVSALFTYFPALAAGSAFELVLSKNSPRFARAIAFAATIAICALAAISISVAPTKMSFMVCVVGYAISLSLWFLANAENQNLHDLPPANSATGGDANVPAVGNLDGFTT